MPFRTTDRSAARPNVPWTAGSPSRPLWPPTSIRLVQADGERRLRDVVEMTRGLDDLPTAELLDGLITRPVEISDRPAIARALDVAMRDQRRRGIAGALIARNLRLLRERGMTEAALSVDTENPSGALRLYERHGFRETDRVIVFRNELPPVP